MWCPPPFEQLILGKTSSKKTQQGRDFSVKRFMNGLIVFGTSHPKHVNK